MGNSSSKSPSFEFHSAVRITRTRRRRGNYDAPDAIAKTLPKITGPPQRMSISADSTFSETNTPSHAPPPYSAETIFPSVPPHSLLHADNQNIFAPTVSRSGSMRAVPLDIASESSGQSRVMTPLNPGSQHTQFFMIPADASSGKNTEYLRKPMRRESAENALEMLRKYDTVVIVDDSSSMKGALWNEARDALASLADIAGRYDTDGIEVHFLNAKHFMSNIHQSSTVKQLFDSVRPRGITPIGKKLEELLLVYLANLETAKGRERAGDANAMKVIKPVNYIVLTDGAPTDDPEGVIIAAAKRLDRGNFSVTQVGIQFVQIGNSKKASDFLKELDDDLPANHGVRDIVDTTPYIGRLNAEILTKILLGGINRRVDRKGGGSVMS